MQNKFTTFEDQKLQAYRIQEKSFEEGMLKTFSNETFKHMNEDYDL